MRIFSSSLPPDRFACVIPLPANAARTLSKLDVIGAVKMTSNNTWSGWTVKLAEAVTVTEFESSCANARDAGMKTRENNLFII